MTNVNNKNVARPKNAKSAKKFIKRLAAISLVYTPCALARSWFTVVLHTVMDSDSENSDGAWSDGDAVRYRAGQGRAGQLVDDTLVLHVAAAPLGR